MIDQSRAIDNQRFKKRLERLPDSIFNEIKGMLRKLGEL